MSSTPADNGHADAPTPRRIRSGPRGVALAAGVVVVVAAAAFMFGYEVRSSPKASSATAPVMQVSTDPGTGSPGTPNVMTVRGAGLPSMAMPSAAPAPMAMVPLGQSEWSGMKIQARASAPATFALFHGTTQQLVRPGAKDSFHLMVGLSDAATGYPIPYSSVWATIRKGRELVYDERLWPMISRSTGPHYGNNVALPAAGLYRLTLLVGPPVAARHLEYRGIWLKPHRVSLTFRWVPKT